MFIFRPRVSELPPIWECRFLIQRGSHDVCSQKQDGCGGGGEVSVRLSLLLEVEPTLGSTSVKDALVCYKRWARKETCQDKSWVTLTFLSQHSFSMPEAGWVFPSPSPGPWLNFSGCHRQSNLRKASKRLWALRSDTESDQDESELINIPITSLWFTLVWSISTRLKWLSLSRSHLKSPKRVTGVGEGAWAERWAPRPPTWPPSSGQRAKAGEALHDACFETVPDWKTRPRRHVNVPSL